MVKNNSFDNTDVHHKTTRVNVQHINCIFVKI